MTKINFAKQPWHYWQTRTKDRIIRYFPRYKKATQREDFCRVKLTLHHSHRHHDELKSVDDIPFTTYSAAYQPCQENHCHDDDYYGAEVEGHEEEFDDGPGEDEEDPPEAANPIPWDELA